MDSSATKCERCGSELPRQATAFLVEGQVVCRECHDELEPRCPTCGKLIESRPESTGPCPQCGWPIHVAREQDLFETTLINKQQIDHLARMRRKIGVLRRFGVTEGDYERTRAQLHQQTGDQPDDTMVMRRLYYQANRNCQDDGQRATVAHAEARFLYDKGLDYLNVLRKAHRFQLAQYKERGFDGAVISGPSTCAYCRKRSGEPLPIDRELEDPELPYPDCPNRTAESEVVIEGERTQYGVNKNAFCEARYEPCEP